MRILVVDDEPSLLLTLTANLELEGFEVKGAENAAEALRALETAEFDLVLSDIRMPGMNGVDLYRRIREQHPGLPVVLMTGFALEGLVQAAMSEGAYAVLSKPCPMDQVTAVVSRALRGSCVLVVDDAASTAETTAAALSACGIRARSAPDAASAIAAVHDGQIDVCVVDMVMPLDGPSLMQELAALDPGIVFIAISGESATDLLRRAAAMGAFACVRKPLAPADLAQVIARARASPPRANRVRGPIG